MDDEPDRGTATKYRCCKKVSPPGVAAVSRNSVVIWVRDGDHGQSTKAAGQLERGVDVTTTIAASPLTATDRCDRCGAQAYVRATMESGFDLLLCGHHWRENETRLREIAVSIQDESTKLTDVPATAPVEER